MVGKADGCHHEDNIEGDSDNNAKDADEEPEGAGEGPEDANEEPEDADEEPEDADEEPEDGENNEDLETPLARRLWPQSVKTGNYNLNFDHGSQTSSSDTSYREGPATSDQGSTHESDAGEDLDLDHNSPSSPPTKCRKRSSATTHLRTVRTKPVNASISHGSNPTPASIVFGPTPNIDPTEEAWVIGAKYGKSARTILIEAGLSIKHSRSESDWNAHQRWFMDNHPCKDKESIIDWKERQCKHYHAMGKENEQWDIIRNYNVTGGNTNQSRAKTILSMREDIARKASGFVAGSNLIVKLINEHQLDARAILDWVMTATKANGYNISVLQFMGGVGAYEILLSKPNEAPHDHYRRIWPIMVLDHTSKFGYRPKAVQWRKLLDYAFQYKFMIKNWPDDVLPIGPKFNPHNLSSQHLKLLIVPFIKRKKSKGKHRGRTVEDIMSELDVNVPEIEFAAWPDGAGDVVLCKLVDSAKFKVSVPEDILAAHEAHPDTHKMLPSDHESSVTPSPPTLPSNQHHPTNFTAVHRREEFIFLKRQICLIVNLTLFCLQAEMNPSAVEDDRLACHLRQRKLYRSTLRLCAAWRSVPLILIMTQTWKLSPTLVVRTEISLPQTAAVNYSRSPPVYPERDGPARTRYYRPNPTDNRLQVRGAGDSHYEDGPSRFRY
ncbi:hypothetical protein DFH29DRAFT_884069 [Suillus ampliporus]|nr:hypothetical protein DFH29DRAFT_884069 [Suillus ampliporus]